MPCHQLKRATTGIIELAERLLAKHTVTPFTIEITFPVTTSTRQDTKHNQVAIIGLGIMCTACQMLFTASPHKLVTSFRWSSTKTHRAKCRAEHTRKRYHAQAAIPSISMRTIAVASRNTRTLNSPIRTRCDLVGRQPCSCPFLHGSMHKTKTIAKTNNYGSC